MPLQSLFAANLFDLQQSHYLAAEKSPALKEKLSEELNEGLPSLTIKAGENSHVGASWKSCQRRVSIHFASIYLGIHHISGLSVSRDMNVMKFTCPGLLGLQTGGPPLPRGSVIGFLIAAGAKSTMPCRILLEVERCVLDKNLGCGIYLVAADISKRACIDTSISNSLSTNFVLEACDARSSTPRKMLLIWSRV